ncbi:exosortase D, VPLPA-CTERM-specific [Limihaloglobus sulfuriphilus]|uniref:Exosortase D, VPLPA-CTERM-specific n=1 Tax=Limihaloglobus sulfuriphilus TaxID=1851148 RepID=A0A1Q2MHZ4_9BACT|nr:exosortase/archaeosortase family protein [Limihaloglobus sulfuriphilus]AQQ71917.1 exosortase D, VPLPA-CTERM-specific [Limihaloglobus sulfuriphilus]
MTESISISPSENQTKYEWKSLGFHSFIKMAVIGFLFACLFWTEISDIVNRWVSDSSWSHGFLIPLFSLYFINQKKNQILSTEIKPSYLGLAAFVFFLFLYVFNGIFLKYAYGMPLIMIASLGAIILFQLGWKQVKYMWLPVAYLFFAVPLPERIYREITIPMRQLASTIAAGLLNLVPELEATATGVIIDVIYKGEPFEPSLNVAEACSGMRLLMAFVALGVAMAYLHDRPVWQRLVLLCSTVPIAILCNIVRVTVTGFIYILFDPKYAQGIYHDMLGMLMLPLAFVFYGFIAWFMENLIVEEDKEPKGKVVLVSRREDQ